MIRKLAKAKRVKLCSLGLIDFGFGETDYHCLKSTRLLSATSKILASRQWVMEWAVAKVQAEVGVLEMIRDNICIILSGLYTSLLIYNL